MTKDKPFELGLVIEKFFDRVSICIFFPLAVLVGIVYNIVKHIKKGFPNLISDIVFGIKDDYYLMKEMWND